MAELLQADPEELRRLLAARIPFGKYQGQRLIDLPEPYVVWLVRHQLPEGRLGEQLLAIYDIKVNGLEGLLRPLCPKSD
jgi:uncharacterized protein (DUF3820 family)